MTAYEVGQCGNLVVRLALGPQAPAIGLICREDGAIIIRGQEEPYRFVSVGKLRRDFEADVAKHGGKHEKEDRN